MEEVEALFEVFVKGVVEVGVGESIYDHGIKFIKDVNLPLRLKGTKKHEGVFVFLRAFATLWQIDSFHLTLYAA